MNIETFFKIMQDNRSDVEYIVNKLGGIEGIFDIIPDLFRIWKTATDAAAGDNPKQALRDLHATMTGSDLKW